MLEKQGGVCAICQRPERKVVRGTIASLAVDHSHSTGEVRGLLCSSCNTALGLFGDDPARLSQAIAYIHGSASAREDSRPSPTLPTIDNGRDDFTHLDQPLLIPPFVNFDHAIPKLEKLELQRA